MSSTSETGHAKNVANFGDLISFVTAYGTSYKPPKTSLKLTTIKTLQKSAQDAITLINSTTPPYKKAVSEREAEFEPLSKLTTRIINILEITDASEQIVDDAKSIARKIQGVRAKKIDKDDTEAKHSSTSQMSYDSRLDNFDKLLKLIATITEYKPNEKELQLSMLITYYKSLQAKNAAVDATNTSLSSARIKRDKVLYAENSGLYDIAMDIKKYVKVLFGSSSPEYKQISKLKFVNIAA